MLIRRAKKPNLEDELNRHKERLPKSANTSPEDFGPNVVSDRTSFAKDFTTYNGKEVGMEIPMDYRDGISFTDAETYGRVGQSQIKPRNIPIREHHVPKNSRFFVCQYVSIAPNWECETCGYIVVGVFKRKDFFSNSYDVRCPECDRRCGLLFLPFGSRPLIKTPENFSYYSDPVMFANMQRNHALWGGSYGLLNDEEDSKTISRKPARSSGTSNRDSSVSIRGSNTVNNGVKKNVKKVEKDVDEIDVSTAKVFKSKVRFKLVG
jgi:hypothetical protein